ncbi:MAG TPA: organoarsenical effux MFS transporter ArsJ [Kofleriaceae bacterium]|nr:organoarsenical effux MFS transporter ArsJ [Kofleriaceae bacterium]
MSQIRSYIVVTAAYWAFTLTDGALRMLVLLHFHELGYSPFELASLFFLYELFGVLTNLIGGWLASRTGLKATLFIGLSLQIAALLMLSALSPAWIQTAQVAYVVIAQGLSGIAKDFTKLSSKSAIKVLVPDGAHGTLFRWVALLTGSKNTLKGVGFFLGGLLLSQLGFRNALWSMVGGLAITLVLSALMLPAGMGRAKVKVKLSRILAKSRAINVLSAARLFLFGARDVWFVVALPVFLYDVVGWTFVEVGSYMAAWVIGYGAVQAFTPRLLDRAGAAHTNDARSAQLWGFLLAAVPLGIYAALRAGAPASATVVVGLGIFGVLFAINSAVHSYLILAYSKSDEVALNIGFYYMANAAGRLVGTIASGLVYQYAGLGGCLLTAGGMVLVASGLALLLPNPRAATRGCP